MVDKRFEEGGQWLVQGEDGFHTDCVSRPSMLYMLGYWETRPPIELQKSLAKFTSDSSSAVSCIGELRSATE